MEYVNKSITYCDGKLVRVSDDFEYSIHKCPKILYQDFLRVFNPPKHEKTDVSLMLVWQKTPLSVTCKSVELYPHLDRLFERCHNFAKVYLSPQVKWFDLVCPYTGGAYRGQRSCHTWSEIKAHQLLLGYQYQSLNSCHMLVHPKWNDCGYPTTIAMINRDGDSND